MHAFKRGAVPLQILDHPAKHDVHGAYMMEQLTSNGYSVSSGSLQPTAHQAKGDMKSSNAQVYSLLGTLPDNVRVVMSHTRRAHAEP